MKGKLNHGGERAGKSKDCLKGKSSRPNIITDLYVFALRRFLVNSDLTRAPLAYAEVATNRSPVFHGRSIVRREPLNKVSTIGDLPRVVCSTNVGVVLDQGCMRPGQAEPGGGG